MRLERLRCRQEHCGYKYKRLRIVLQLCGGARTLQGGDSSADSRGVTNDDASKVPKASRCDDERQI